MSPMLRGLRARQPAPGPLWGPPAAAAPRSGPPPALEVARVARWFGHVVAVNDISFELGGGITGLLGPNGAGKSTLLHMLSGLLRPSAGEVRVEGTPTWGRPEMYRRVGLVPERDTSYAFLTGYEFALLCAHLHRLPDPEAAARRAIGTVGLDDARDRPIGGYSKGMRQRAKLAGALVHDPPILLLDEPFNGMDPRQRLQMMDLLRSMAAEGRVILFSSHILEEVERLAENVLVIVAGRLAASGDFREIRRLMTDRPHTFTIRSSDDRALGSALLRQGAVMGVQLSERRTAQEATNDPRRMGVAADADLVDGQLDVHVADFGAFTRAVARVARETGVTVYELRPTDESLEMVFSYLVAR